MFWHGWLWMAFDDHTLLTYSCLCKCSDRNKSLSLTTNVVAFFFNLICHIVDDYIILLYLLCIIDSRNLLLLFVLQFRRWPQSSVHFKVADEPCSWIEYAFIMWTTILAVALLCSFLFLYFCLCLAKPYILIPFTSLCTGLALFIMASFSHSSGLISKALGESSRAS